MNKDKYRHICIYTNAVAHGGTYTIYTCTNAPYDKMNKEKIHTKSMNDVRIKELYIIMINKVT